MPTTKRTPAQTKAILALDATYHRLVELEGVDPDVDAILDAVSTTVTKLCPDFAEYSQLTSHALPVRDKHDHSYSYMVTYVAAPVVGLRPSEFGVDLSRSLGIVHENAIDWVNDLRGDPAMAIEQIEVVAAECLTEPLHCEVRNSLGLNPGQDAVVYRRPLFNPEGAPPTA